MIANFADHSKRKEREKNYEQLVDFFSTNIVQTSAWMLILSITYNVEQMNFPSRDAHEMAKLLCQEFDIRFSAIQYFATFASTPSCENETKPSNVIKIAIKTESKKRAKLISELRTALQNQTIEYRQAVELVIKIIKNYPDTEKHLQG